MFPVLSWGLLPKRPEDGAADAAAAGAWLAFPSPVDDAGAELEAPPPNRLEPPPKRFEAGLSAGLALPPKRLPDDGVVLAPPKAEEAGAAAEGVELLAPPKRFEPDEEGVLEKRPPGF